MTKPGFSSSRHLQLHGIEPTLQRIAVLDDLYEHRTHATADEIFERVAAKYPTISRRTIYNALNLFVEKGAVAAINIDETHVRYDFDVRFHGHFRCRECGRIFDFVMHRPHGAERFGSIDSAQYYVYGLCRDCAEKNQSTNQPIN